MAKSKISKRVKELEKDTWNEKHFQKQTELMNERREIMKGMTNEEKLLWKKIREFIHADLELLKEHPNDKSLGRLKLEWFDKLDVKYDVLFIRSKKNTGKTYQLSRMVQGFLAKDPKSEFIYMRNTTGELEAVDDQMWGDVNWPIYKKGSRLYVKTFDSKKEICCGRCISLTGESPKTAQGASNRERLKAIIYDEANFTKSQYGLRSEDFTKLPVLFSSLVRDRKDVKIYMFGNTLRNEDGSTSDIFLDSLGVVHGVPLKLLDFPTPDGTDVTKVLYIDFGSELKGAESQKFLNIFGGIEDLLTNNPQARSKKILGINYFLDARPVFAYLFSLKSEEKIMYVGELFDNKTKLNHLIIKIENYNHDRTYKYQPFTDELPLFAKYYPRMKQPEKENICDVFMGFQNFLISQRLWFTDEDSSTLLTICLKFWRRKFDLDYEKSDWA